MRPLALLTDFGLKDPYVGIVKGVILGINPDARIIDITHDVPSQSVLDAYLILSHAWSHFPDGTVFVAVVDPEVGTDRKILLAQTDRHLFLAPDNGLLGFVEKQGLLRRLLHVRNPRYFLDPVSDTFHGRDIFAPVAAHLSKGLDPGKLGPEVRSLRRLSPPEPHVTREGVIVGEILSIDHFGNLVTNIPGNRLRAARSVSIRIGRKTIPRLSRSYAEGRKGELVAVVGSTGHVEISVNLGDARRRTGARVGDIIRARHSLDKWPAIG